MSTVSGRRGRDCDWRAWLSRRDGRARERLIAAHLPLVAATAARLGRAPWARGWEADLYGAGCAGLVRALDSYDPARGAAFETAALGHVRGAVRECLRACDHLTRHQRSVRPRDGEGLPPARLDAPAGAGLTPAGLLAAPDDTAAAAMLRVEAARVRAAVAGLPARERLVVARRYWGGQTFAASAAGLGAGGEDVTARRAEQLWRRAAGRLRGALGD